MMEISAWLWEPIPIKYSIPCFTLGLYGKKKKRGRKKNRPVYLELQAFRPDQSMDETEDRKETGCTRRWRVVKVVRNICEDEVKLCSFEYKGTKQLCSYSFGFWILFLSEITNYFMIFCYFFGSVKFIKVSWFGYLP